MDRTSLLGLAVVAGALLSAQWIEGGRLASLLQPSAALIVLGGTAGATLLSVPWAETRRALGLLAWILSPPVHPLRERIEQFARMASVARKDGIVALDARVRELGDPFIRRAVHHVVDGTQSQGLRRILETDLDGRLDADLAAARVFDVAGGYAPTVGILGAVLGLIHAVERLDDPTELGRGIAVAFVATVYGVGVANLLLHPVASRLERLLALRRVHDELVVEGAIALQSGLGPAAIRSRLAAFLGEHPAYGGGRAP